ncbi:sigma-70 family RNA polymerase sigma factor, partial [Acinetobacter baumannii]
MALLDAAAEDREVNERLAVWRAIEALPPLERETIVLDFVEGHRHEEIAEQMGVSVATVRSRLQSAKRKLRSDLRTL